MYLKNCKLNIVLSDVGGFNAVAKLVRHLQEIAPSDSYIKLKVSQPNTSKEYKAALKISSSSGTFSFKESDPQLDSLLTDLNHQIEEQIHEWQKNRFKDIPIKNGATA